MAGITGIGTTFNLPNYHGELIALTPVDTPLLSLAGGLGGGGQTQDTEFEWSTYDLRDPDMRPRLEGADAPSSEERVRAGKSNIVQIFHEAVGTTYTKQAAVERYAANSLNTGSSGSNVVRNEHAWQIEQSLIQIARDVNYTFWHSTYNKPVDNTTARRTRGLLEAIQTNRVAVDEVSATAATDTVTAASHGLTDGDAVVFTSVGASTTLRVDRAYYVVSSASGTFKVATTPGGSAVTIGTANVKYVAGGNAAVDADTFNEWMQGIWDNGGISGQETSTLFVPSRQKRAITAAYADKYGKADMMMGSRTVAGLNVQTIETDFGRLNLVLERALPPDMVALVDLAEVDPVFLSIPGKGVLFEEELAKTGATDKTQIYGELGLKYGNELRHGVIRGLGF